MATMQDNLKAFMEAGARYYACPTGTMLPFGGTTVPTGFLLCNGAAVSRTTYAKLFAAIGTKWGTGDGSTTFNLPNCNDRCLEGTTNTSNVGKYLEAGLPDISGGFTTTHVRNNIGDSRSCYGAITTSANRAAYTGSYYETSGCGSWNFSASKSNSKYGNSSVVQPKSFYAFMIIKV